MNEDYAHNEDPEQQEEWLRQSNLIYGGLVAIGMVMVQPFLTGGPPDVSAKICVVAFSAAIPLLAALILLNGQERFLRRASSSRSVAVTKATAQLSAFVGVTAGFWHIFWIAGVVMLAAGTVAVLVHSAGYVRLDGDWGSNTSESKPDDTE